MEKTCRILYFLSIFFFAMVSADLEVSPDFCALASANPEVAFPFCPYMLLYKDGSLKRFEPFGKHFVPPSLDPKTNVQSKDVIYEPEKNLTARVYLPQNTKPNQKLPLLVYYYGGSFAWGSPYSIGYHNYLNTLVNVTKVIAVSVYYRRPPEDPLPIAHKDAWTAFKWVASHVNGEGPEEWLNRHADFQRMFFHGERGGANLAHNVAIRNGLEKLRGVKIEGIILSTPFFWGNKLLDGEKNDTRRVAEMNKLLQIIYPAARGYDIPLLNPAADPNLVNLGCSRVLNLVAGSDFLTSRGRYYFETLMKSGWNGTEEIMEFAGEPHAFYLVNPNSQNARTMVNKIDLFINGNDSRDKTA